MPTVWNFVQKVTADPDGTNDRLSNDRYGAAIATGGDWMAVGAPQHDYDENGENLSANSGAVWIYELVGETWTFRQKIVGFGTNARHPSSQFGNALAMTSDTLAVGADKHLYDENGANSTADAGAVFIYILSGGTWVSQQKIVPGDRAAQDHFSAPNGGGLYEGSLALDGDTLIVGSNTSTDENGANSISNAGGAYIFTRSGSTWTEEQKIVSEHRESSGQFGCAVDLRGDTCIVGARKEDLDEDGLNSVANSGAAYIFDRSGSTWTQTKKLVPTGTNARNISDHFGTAVSITSGGGAAGARAAVSASFESGNSHGYDVDGANLVDSHGAIWIFKRNGSWAQEQKIVSTHTREEAEVYGNKLKFSPDDQRLMVFSRNSYDEDGLNFEEQAGAIWIWELSGGSFVLEDKIVPDNVTADREAFTSSWFLDWRSSSSIWFSNQWNTTDENGANALGAAGASWNYALPPPAPIAWSQALEVPVPPRPPIIEPPGGDLPFGPGGLPPDFDEPEPGKMTWQDQHRPRIVTQDFEEREPLFFGEVRMRIDWETPFQHDLTRRRVVLVDQQVEADVPRAEEMTLDKWYTSFPQEFRDPGQTIFPMEQFVNLNTGENEHQDALESTTTKLLPNRRRTPVESWPMNDGREPSFFLSELITLDKYWTSLSHPIFIQRYVPLGEQILDADPIPDPPLLPSAIPWWTPLSVPNPTAAIATHANDSLVNIFTGASAALVANADMDRDVVREPPWIASALEFTGDGEDLQENITLDKFFVPLSQVKNPPLRLPPDTTLARVSGTVFQEEITLDKWYSATTAQTEFTHRALRAVTGPEGQDYSLTVLTAPWIEFAYLDPLPIPNIPGVTDSFWTTSLAIPRMEDPFVLALYRPLQRFPVEDPIPECERPRRRPARRRSGCGVPSR